jgi:hypothetical protein
MFTDHYKSPEFRNRLDAGEPQLMLFDKYFFKNHDGIINEDGGINIVVYETITKKLREKQRSYTKRAVSNRLNPDVGDIIMKYADKPRLSMGGKKNKTKKMLK